MHVCFFIGLLLCDMSLAMQLDRASNSSGSGQSKSFQKSPVGGLTDEDLGMRGASNRGRGSLTADILIGKNASSRGAAGQEMSGAKARRSTAPAPSLPPLPPSWQK